MINIPGFVLDRLLVRFLTGKLTKAAVHRKTCHFTQTHYSDSVFAITPNCCILSGEAANTNFNVVGLTLPGIKPMTFHTRGEHAKNYTT